jgi:hypothetical protein
MEIVFTTTPETIYRYSNVPMDVFCELINAESVGSYFAKRIRKQYPDFVKATVTHENPLCGVASGPGLVNDLRASTNLQLPLPLEEPKPQRRKK